MGSWGVGVFADDLALDVRGEWRDALLRREDPVAVSQRMAARLARGDTTEWLALAAAQHETGHLQPEVRDRALELIDTGSGLELWAQSGQLAARRAVLERLAARLRAPQPRPKRLRGPRAIDPEVEVGDVVRIHDERRTVSVLFAVIGMSRTVPAQPRPLVLGLYADPDGPFDADRLAAAPYLADLDFSAFRGDEPPAHMGVATPATQLILTSARERLADVGEIVARGAHRPAGPDLPSGGMTGWRGLRAGYCDARTQRILRRVTEQRLERYGPSDDAHRIEREAQVSEYEERMRDAKPLLDRWRRGLADGEWV